MERLQDPAGGPVVTKNLFAVLVSSIGVKAHVSTSSGPLKLVANGQPEGDVGPEGVDVKNFQGGVLEFADGRRQRSAHRQRKLRPAAKP